MALKPLAFACAALACLASCGSRAEDPALNAVRGFASDLLGRGDAAPAAPAVDPRQVLTRALIDRTATPLLLVENAAAGTSSTVVIIATNGPNETWQGGDPITFTLSREGVLRATRGFITDLYAADIEDTRAALVNRRAGVVQRLYVDVEGDIEETRVGYTCEIGFGGAEPVTIFERTRSLTRMTETCSRQPDGESFVNRYWIDGTGFAWASEQWAGPELGHFRFERLYR
ncbi:YjbF family lipoprotein [Hasllibacter sp. MH4015]|uniref:YjbF family lipoprotein n=1 Tax=Hasllibacter sp. MH4015 TaxID=2854029 RepID=UPI001CD5CC84|nr:YjbF family lipoprotein [Hasllibacter sp. MH4015]